MQYHGKLYGKIAGVYFDTGVTSDDYDTLEQKLKAAEKKLEWILTKDKLPEASDDKTDWWTSPTGEVFPYSKKCLVEDIDGDISVSSYSILENVWDDVGVTVVKWRYI